MRYNEVMLKGVCDKLTPYIGCAALSLISCFLGSSLAFAENVDYSVNVAPSLKLTIPDSSLILNLNPPSKTFDSKDLTVTVGTNNATGYKLTLSTPNDNTDLERDTSGDTTAISATIPTLNTGTYTESTFTANKWGYKINTNTAIPSIITSDYIPFTSGNTLMERDTAVNQDQTNLTFASKIDYLQPAGAYSTTLQFNIVANPPIYYMQDFTTEMCRTLASRDNYTVVDKRDNNDYTVRYINGNCWMTQNLRYQGDTVGSTSTTTSWIMKSATSNISEDTTMTMTDLTDGNTYDAARYHVATLDQVPSGASYTAEDMGVWYNYAAASAMTITGSSNSSVQTYDICPKGWRLPTGGSNSEQSGITSYSSAYSPVAGGYYLDGSMLYGTGYGYWWSSTSTSNSAASRYYLRWYGSSLSTDYGARGSGRYVRCIRSS